MNLQAAAACVLRFKPPTVVRMNHPQCFLGVATPSPKKLQHLWRFQPGFVAQIQAQAEETCKNSVGSG